MVLPEAGSEQDASSTSFADDLPPSSDIDHYAGSNPPYSSTRDPSYIKIEQAEAEPIFVNMQQMPQPVAVPIFSTQRLNPKVVQELCRRASELMKRPVTQQEADAFTFHTAKTVRIVSLGPPLGFLWGLIQCYRKRAGFKMPFLRTPEGASFDRFGPVRGPAAEKCWHFMRAGAYTSLGVVGGSAFLGSYGLSVRIAGFAMDQRLKEYNEALRKHAQETAMKGASSGQSEGAKPGETFEMARQRRSAQMQQHRQWQTQTQPGEDDMSPTGGAFEQDFTQEQGGSGMMDDGQAQQYNYRRTQNDSQNSPTSTYNTSQSTSQRRLQTSGRNSSPSQQPDPNQQSTKQSGSAWDRVRLNAISGSPSQASTQSQPARSSPAQGNSRSTSGGSESFSFSQSDEDKQLARAEAQREFDARIDKEREGQDFQDRGRKW